MKVKKCLKCGKVKPLEEFYKHKQMKDGHLNKCIECTKKDVADRVKELNKIPEWVKQERKRNRDKYHRLNYKDKHKPNKMQKKMTMKRYNERYPEKRIAKCKSQRLKAKKGFHLHHWSYNLKDAKDVIEISIADHNLLHRHLFYDKELFMYRDENGELLNSKQSHIDLLNKIKSSETDT